jgi:uroporphyrin-III C-methyltransferase
MARACSVQPSRASGFGRGLCIASNPRPSVLVRSSSPSSASPSSSSASYYVRQSTEELLALLRSRDAESASSTPSCPTPVSPSAKVWLVGTGPGDVDLLTMKAVKLMQRADVVLYDRLVSPDILELVSKDALMVYVGKQESYHTRTQEEIHALMGMFASELGPGSTVVRLKGGDPFVFGRGGEEVEYLRGLGINVGVVPGITSACAIGAELSIPLTHRGLATSVRFLTGHARENGQSDIDVAMATAFDPKTTLVIYMGLKTLETTVKTLIEGGLPGDTPAVAVEKGCTREQRTVFARLDELYDAVEGAQPKLVSPTLIIIGHVVSLAAQGHQISVDLERELLTMPS